MWWQYRRTVTEFRGGISIIPLVIALIVIVEIARHGHAIEHGITTFITWAAIIIGSLFGLGILLAMALVGRAIQRGIKARQPKQVYRPGYVINPEPVAEIPTTRVMSAEEFLRQNGKGVGADPSISRPRPHE